MKKINILILGMDDSIGGIGSFIINFYRHINHNFYQIDFLTSYNTLAFKNEIIENCSNIYYYTPKIKNLIKSYNDLKLFFKTNGAHYQFVWIHNSSIRDIYPYLFAEKYTQAKIICHSHASAILTKNFFLRIYYTMNHYCLRKKLLSLIDYKFACSDIAGEFMFGKRNLNDLQIVKNCIETEKIVFNPVKREEYRLKFNFGNKIVFAHFGRFVEIKNHLFLLDVFSNIYLKNKNTILILVGDGDFRSKIEKKINKLKLSNNIVLTGIRYDIADIMQASDIFVLPSKKEGLPLTAIEAQASGLRSFFSDSITPESKITNLVTFISLKKTADQWASIILDNIHYERKDMHNDITTAGYDAEEVTKDLDIFFKKNI